jgi:hypothetical protein
MIGGRGGRFVWALMMIIIVLVTGTLSAASARAETGTGYSITTTDGEAVLVGATSGPVTAKGASVTTSAGAVAAAGTPPWPACGISDKNTKVLYQYSRAQIAGVSGARATLACGSSEWGFRHIKAGHLSQWEAKANLIGALWMDMAHWSIIQTLSRPCSQYRQTSNDTLQYVAPFQVRDSQGRVVQTFGVRVVVARVTQNIITTYPQTATC